MIRAEEAAGRPLAEALAEDYARMDLEEVGAKYGVSHQSISAWMARLGIERRLPGQPPPLRTNGKTPDPSGVSRIDRSEV